jgi:CRP/FNR family transcriptional regulator, cyclic AMP receptor protein
MQTVDSNIYFVWGVDETPYGPVEFSTLTDWIKDERIVPDTWIFSRAVGSWQKASSLAELKNLFGIEVATPDFDKPFTSSLKPGTLRRIKILADLNDTQLAQLASYLEVQEVKQWLVIFSQGDASDAMYLVMSGELRARTMAGGKEIILATFGPGEFFGDMALFDHGPRSADVLVNVDSTLLKLSASAFERMTREAPALATPFLQATARTLSARIRNDNKKLARITQQYAAGSGL